jgi:hypothetical protein
MKLRTTITLLIIAGIIGLIGAVWSGSGAGLGPVRQGTGEPISSGTQNIVMILALIGSVGAFAVAALQKVLGNKILGVGSLIFGALLVPSLFQANVLSIIALGLLILVGISLLMTTGREQQVSTGS